MKPCNLSAACHVPKGLLAKESLEMGVFSFSRGSLTFISQNFDTSCYRRTFYITHISSVFIEQCAYKPKT